MRDKELYAQILGLQNPWSVREVALNLEKGEVVIHVHHNPLTPLLCPACGSEVPGYDTRERRWRHLDTCQYRTILSAEIPRCNCPEHGVHQVAVPWSDPGSRFTALFEALVINWLKVTSMSAVARNIGLSWDQIDGIMQRAVRRGLERREKVYPKRIGVDETSFKKRHKYVTAVQDQDSGNVLHVASGRGQESLDEFYDGLDSDQLEGIQSVAMDMHQPFITSTREHVPNADQKIAFDRFHVAMHLNDAVDQVRRQEHRELQAEKDDTLKGTKYVWLQNPENMKPKPLAILAALRDSSLRTVAAWAIKESAKGLWDYVTRGWATRAWEQWLSWALGSGLEPIVKAATTIKNHLWGIINSIYLFAFNADSESLNAKIQKLKLLACGFRNQERFKAAIMFHLGGLELYPETMVR